jgi:hypothetical protein
MKQIAVAVLCLLMVVARAEDITGVIRLNPSITHSGTGAASTLTETIGDVWRWGGGSGVIGTNGSAAGLNKLWVYSGSLAGGATNTFDLAGGVTNSFGQVLTFARVKFLLLAPSNSMTTAQSVLLQPAPANGWGSWQSTTTSAARVYSGGAWAVFAPCTNAYAVTAGTGDLIDIINESTNAATYRLYIAGE